MSRFDEVHFQQDRDLLLSVIRVERTSARDTKRDPRVSWFLTLDKLVPLEQVPARYALRFSEEHLFRFLKQDLLWLAAHVRTPEQLLRWSWIVALAFLQLYLARPLGLSAAMAFVLSLGDLTAITLFGSQNLVTLPALIYAQMGSYRIDAAAGSALILALFSMAIITLLDRGGARA